MRFRDLVVIEEYVERMEKGERVDARLLVAVKRTLRREGNILQRRAAQRRMNRWPE